MRLRFTFQRGKIYAICYVERRFVYCRFPSLRDGVFFVHGCTTLASSSFIKPQVLGRTSVMSILFSF
ncbi:hypothetical protein ACOSP7_028056 [Xanthoceras sorbifolium]